MAKHYLKLSQTLKKLLFERDMKPADLARELDIPSPTIHRIVTGKSTRPYKSSLKPIADYFSIDVEELIGENIPKDNHEISAETKKILLKSKIKFIPVIDWVEANNKQIVNKDHEQIAVHENTGNNCFALIMNDYSMQPLFPKNTILIFDTDKTPTDRSYVLVKLDGVDIPIFRQILIDADHQYLKPINPDLNQFNMRILKKNDTILAALLESRTNFGTEDTSNKLLE